jgi:HK97 family phage prohead protease
MARAHVFTRVEVANMQGGMETRAVWSTAYINSLPDSAFLLVFTDAKGEKQRFFPVKDANGTVDAAHVNNALSRIPQASTLTADQRVTAMAAAKKLSAGHPEIASGATAQYEGSAGSGRSRRDFDIPAEALGLQERCFPLLMELRENSDGRTLFGRAVPYNVIGQPGNFRERFLPGVFARQLSSSPPSHVKLYDAHTSRLDGRAHVGRTMRLSDQPDGLYGEWHIFDTRAGEDALTMVREHEITGLSVGFKTSSGGSRRASDGVIERVVGHLDHVALTHEPVYADAGVLAIRSTGRLDQYEADRERFRLFIS